MRKDAMETTTTAKPNKPKEKEAKETPAKTEPAKGEGAPASEPALTVPPGDLPGGLAGTPQRSTPAKLVATPRLERAAAERKAVGPRIDPRTITWLASTFPTQNEGAGIVLDGVSVLYRRTLAELRGRLDASQARLVLDALNGAEVSACLVGQRLGLAVRDAVDTGELPRKWSVDGRGLLRAVGSLTAFQAASLEWWAAAFWQGPLDDPGFEPSHVALIAGDGAT
jgi:hypothetical protein